MSIFKILKNNSTLVCFTLLTLIMFFIPLEVLAQDAGDVTDAARTTTGPFALFLSRAATLFMQTRNALFVVAAFAFIQFAWTAIKDGTIDKEKIFWLIMGLVILGVAGWIVSYLADPSTPTNLTTNFEGISDTTGWGN